jgi:MSHA biogenesis protein MshJ
MMKAWRGLAERFDALSRRERLSVAFAVLALVVFVLHASAIGPQLARRTAAERMLAQQQSELRSLAEQLAALEEGSRDPDASLRARIARLEAQLQQADQRLTEWDRVLVQPSDMPAILHDLLARRPPVQLVSLRTLPAAGLIDAPATKDGDRAAIYKHAFELTLRGGYLDLLGYLADAERLPRRLFWDEAHLEVSGYPRSTLRVTVFTLSLERPWLSV